MWKFSNSNQYVRRQQIDQKRNFKNKANQLEFAIKNVKTNCFKGGFFNGKGKRVGADES